jgi:hypothetical protein
MRQCRARRTPRSRTQRTWDIPGAARAIDHDLEPRAAHALAKYTRGRFRPLSDVGYRFAKARTQWFVVHPDAFGGVRER